MNLTIRIDSNDINVILIYISNFLQLFKVADKTLIIPKLASPKPLKPDGHQLISCITNLCVQTQSVIVTQTSN